MRHLVCSTLAIIGLSLSVTPVSAAPINAGRLSGETRFETAVEVSKQMVPQQHQLNMLYLTRSDDAADAITVGPLAKLSGPAPVLITPKDMLHPATQAEMTRALKPGGTVTIVGGAKVVSEKVAKQIRNLGYKVQRLAGKNRADTAAMIADKVNTIKPVQEVFVGNMNNWYEPLFLSPIAAHRDGVVLLSDADRNAPETTAWLAKHKNTKRVAGFVNVTRNPALTDAWTKTTLEAAVVERAFTEFNKPAHVGIVTNDEFPDALTAAAYMAKMDGPVLFVDHDASTKPLHSGIDTALQTHKPGAVHIFGGTKAIPVQVEHAITDPNWKPSMEVAAGNGCDAPRSQYLPDGTWYGWIVGGEGPSRPISTKPNTQLGSVELHYVCYDDVTRRWQPAQRWTNRYFEIFDKKVAEAMIDEKAGEKLGAFTIKNNRVIKYEVVPTTQTMDNKNVDSCLTDGCEYWKP
ncbi:cell wall-binding repeat-containing protein [Stomatohabitans albus]|uniref:cell wall-binding repeat-containing protein n=1 Tax=Stomatohabitans albus TaxID=3110766 RepID=UPI00300CA32B